MLKLLRKIEKFRIILVLVGYLGFVPVLKLLALTTHEPTRGETHIMDFFTPITGKPSCKKEEDC